INRNIPPEQITRYTNYSSFKGEALQCALDLKFGVSSDGRERRASFRIKTYEF
ncbi:unnamed protein product, partial [Allacma fusca]